MKCIVKIGGRAVEYALISFSARTNLLLQALPEGKIRLYVPAELPLRESDLSIREQHSCAPAIPERRTRGSVEAVRRTKGACAG